MQSIKVPHFISPIILYKYDPIVPETYVGVQVVEVGVVVGIVISLIVHEIVPDL